MRFVWVLYETAVNNREYFAIRGVFEELPNKEKLKTLFGLTDENAIELLMTGSAFKNKDIIFIMQSSNFYQ